MPAKRFEKLVQKDQAVAEVIAVAGPIITTTIIENVGRFSRIIFDNDAEGFVWQIKPGSMTVLLLIGESLTIGCLGADTGENLTTEVNAGLLGRVVDPLLRPLDNNTELVSNKKRKIFSEAPDFASRKLLSDQLETGVSLVDTLFPIVKGQRIAVIGDAKSGKSSFVLQALAHQAKLGAVVILVLIAKRAEDIRTQLEYLTNTGALKQMVVIISEIDEHLPQSFTAPYVAAAIAESFWYSGRDVVICYDDLTHHAKLYRELSLRLAIPAGREGYPGDLFYMHSSLLERAGKLASNDATQTVLAIGTTPNGDLTSYLSTSLISMTDGQLIFDLETLHQGHKPAINIQLSVSRVGGRAQSAFAQNLSRQITLALAQARNAEQFSRFGGQVSRTVLQQSELAKRISEGFEQGLNQSYSLLEQRLLFSAILQSTDPANVNVSWLRTVIADVAKQKVSEDEIPALAAEMSHSNPTASAEAATANTPEGQTNG